MINKLLKKKKKLSPLDLRAHKTEKIYTFKKNKNKKKL